MQYLKQSTQVDVRIGPCVDATDGVTPETGITLGAADQAEALKHNGAATSDISARTFAAVTGADGWYDLTLTTGDTDTLGQLDVVVQDSSAMLPVFASFMVVPTNVWDSLFGADNLQVDTVQLSGDSTAANNLESMYDETGYTHETAPASRAQVDGIGAASGGSLNFEAQEDNTGGAIKTVTFVGSVQGATTYANTEAEDGTLHDIDDTGDDIDIVYGFDVGTSRTAVEVTFKGFVQGATDEMVIQAYDFVGTDWETIATIPGQTGTANVTIAASLLLKHTGTGSDLGKVYIRFETASTTPSNLSVDQLLVAAVSIDSGIPNGSSVTLSASAANESYVGNNWTLALGGQAVSGIYVKGASVSGTGTGSNTTFEDCTIEAGASIPAGRYIRCRFAGTSGSPVTESGTGEYIIIDGVSAVAGSATPYFNFAGAGGAVGFNNRRWSGGFHFTGDTNTTVSHEVVAGGGTTFVTGGGNVEIRGDCRAITTTLTGGETVQIIAHTGDITIDGAGASSTVNIWGTHSDISNTATGSPTVTDEGLDTAQVTADTAATLVDTNELQTDDIPGTLATIAGYIDTEVAAIKAVTDNLPDSGALTTIDTGVSNIETDTQDIQSRLPAALSSGNIKADVLAISTSTDAADNLEASAKTIVVDSVDTGYVETTTTLKGGGTATLSAVDDHYNGRIIIFTSGTLQNQATDITDYDGTTKVFTVTALTSAPSDSDTFVIV